MKRLMMLATALCIAAFIVTWRTSANHLALFSAGEMQDAGQDTAPNGVVANLHHISVSGCSNQLQMADSAKANQSAQDGQLQNRGKWEARTNVPSDAQVRNYRADCRSPYIVCWPTFPGTSGYTEYSVDFVADSQPRGTYLSIGCWHMDLSELQRTYPDVDGGVVYAGFQVLDDGSKIAIMSVWDIYAINGTGELTTIHAEKTFPDNPRVYQSFDGEGEGVQVLVDYDWQAGRPYRALVQCGQTSEGNCELEFWVCDLTTGTWEKLVAYDLGYGNTSMSSMACFLENFLVDHAAEVRTMELSNFRARSIETGSWVSARSAVMERQFDEWPGSYSYGSDGSCFWAIATGVPDLCTPPKNGQVFEVTEALTGSPY